MICEYYTYLYNLMYVYMVSFYYHFLSLVMSSANSVESLGTLQWDMIDLAGHLRQERLFVNSEQQNLQTLNEKV